MNPTIPTTARGFFHDLRLQPHLQTEHPWAEAPRQPEEEHEAEHDFLVQNRRPDLLLARTPDQALWALDLP